MAKKEEQKIRMYKLTKWYKSMSKLKYEDRELRLTEKGLTALRNAISDYRKHRWNESYTQFLKDLEVEMLMLLCECKWGEYDGK